MKRTILMVIACVLAAAGIKAETPLFGIKGSIDVTVPGKWHNSVGSIKMYNQGYGFSVGGVCNIDLGKGFYFEPGLSLYYEGYGYNDLLAINANGEVVDYDPKLWKTGLRIPAAFGYVIECSDRFSMVVFTGPEVNYAFAGRNTYKNKELFEVIQEDLFKDQRHIDLAWRCGFGVPISCFLVSLEASFGLTDLNRSPSISYRENRISGTLTYYF